MRYQINDKVYWHETLYKIIHVYENGDVKLQSVRGKHNEICYRVPVDSIVKIEGEK